jgi:hypothetical protein
MHRRFASLILSCAFLVLLAGCSSNQPPADESSTPSTGTTAEKSSGSKKLFEKLAPKPVMVPAGTILTARMSQSLSTKGNHAGDSFAATIVEPVSVDGKVVIPEGATATGTVVDSKSKGRFKGGAMLEIALNSVVINGATYQISTAANTRTLKGKGKRSAVLIGGGTAAGAILGGIFGGGKGAAIGAAAGAGAGTAGTAFTGNQDIVIPAESTMSFTLSQPLEVKM